jgi:hypothetical protein
MKIKQYGKNILKYLQTDLLEGKAKVELEPRRRTKSAS